MINGQDPQGTQTTTQQPPNGRPNGVPNGMIMNMPPTVKSVFIERLMMPVAFIGIGYLIGRFTKKV